MATERGAAVGPLPARVAAKIEVVGDCWLWTGTHNNTGYGMAWWGDRMVTTHRLVRHLLVGDVEPTPTDRKLDMSDSEFTKRRPVLVELTLPAHAWSSAELEGFLRTVAPMLDPRVHGELDRGALDAAWKKSQQLSLETESDASKGDRVHSAHKMLSIWRDVFPRRWFSSVVGSQP